MYYFLFRGRKLDHNSFDYFPNLCYNIYIERGGKRMNVWVLIYQNYEDTLVEGIFTEEGKQKKNQELLIKAKEERDAELARINYNLDFYYEDMSSLERMDAELLLKMRQGDTEAKEDRKELLKLKKKLSSEIQNLKNKIKAYKDQSDELILELYLIREHLLWDRHELNT